MINYALNVNELSGQLKMRSEKSSQRLGREKSRKVNPQMLLERLIWLATEVGFDRCLVKLALPFEQQPLNLAGPVQQTRDSSSSKFGFGVKDSPVEKFPAGMLGNF